MKFYFGSVLQLLGKKVDLTTCIICNKPMTREGPYGLHYCAGSFAAKAFRIPSCSGVTRWVPENRSYLLVGETGSGKSVWMYILIDHYLKKGMKCALIAVDDPPFRVRSSAKLCIDELSEHESTGKLSIVDRYSVLHGGQALEGHVAKDTLADFEETVANLLAKNIKAIFLDSATPLFASYDDREVLSFLTNACRTVKRKGGTFFFSMSPELMRETVKATLPHSADALFEFRHPKSKPTATVGDLGLLGWIKGIPGDSSSSLVDYLREMRLSKMRGDRLYEGWLPFMVGKTGVLLALPTDPMENKLLRQEVRRIIDSLQ